MTANDPAATDPRFNREKLFNRGIITTVNAQFFSAFADNAIFFALLEMLQTGSYGKESTYILQGSFVIFYIALAPIVGFFADNIAKSKILMIGNGLKIIGVLLLFTGISPFLCYAFVGLGAAVYSPAKFGILSEFVNEKGLIKANGLVEGSTIVAILAGSAIGGILAEISIYYALALTIFVYLLAALFNGFIPKIAPISPKKLAPKIVAHQFLQALATLLHDRKARFAIMGTSLFWGGVAVLKLLLNDWVRDILGEGTEMVSQLSVIVGLGVIMGATLAALFIHQRNIRLSLFAGIAMSILIFLFLLQENYLLTYIILLLIGACGGCFLIPLNALLQTRGGIFHTVGSAVAIQNLFENSVMLIAITIFGVLTSFAVFSITTLMALFAALFFGAILGLFYDARKHKIFTENNVDH